MKKKIFLKIIHYQFQSNLFLLFSLESIKSSIMNLFIVSIYTILKEFEDNSFYIFYKMNQKILSHKPCIKTFLVVVLITLSQDFILSIKYLLLYIFSVLKYFLLRFSTLFHISWYLFNMILCLSSSMNVIYFV